MNRKVNKPIASPIQLLDHEQRKMAMLSQMIADLLKVHNDLFKKVDSVERLIDTKRGPKGDKPTKEELLSLIVPVAEMVAEKVLGVVIGNSLDNRILQLTEKIYTQYEEKKSKPLTKNDIIGIVKQLTLDKSQITTIVLEKIKASEKVEEETEVEEPIDNTELYKGFIEYLKTNKLDISHINNLDQTIRTLGASQKPYLHGSGVPSLTAGSGVTLTPKSDGGYVVSSVSSGVGAWTTPPESPDGSNLVFTAGDTAPTDVNADGVLLFDGLGYTYSAGQITFVNPPTQFVRYR